MRKLIIALMVTGWVCVLGALWLPLLGAIQVDAVGLAAMVSAIVIALWPERNTQ